MSVRYPAAVLVLTACLACTARHAASPEARYQLTARPWQPMEISRERYLDVIEGICRFTVRQQDARGAVIDPFLKREHQYSTPYFAFAAGVLLKTGRAKDLLAPAVLAMDHAASCFARGNAGIPDQHGEFFIAPLTAALEHYRGLVPEEQWKAWKERLRIPLEQVWEGEALHLNNWRTYAMKGEWMRWKEGLISRAAAENLIVRSWREGQRARIAGDLRNLYQDHSSDPESHAVEAVGRGNLLALVTEGYDGEFAGEIRQAVERGTQTSLLLQDPSGQCPMNGRTDDHVFNDVLYQLAFEVMAETAHSRGDARLAAQYRRAAMLSFRSIDRWRRTDPPWQGSYYITKNKFDPAERIGYQPASNYGNYNGAVMMHLAEAWLARRTEIPEQPAPVEVGGYALATDPGFSSVFANAGGMQMAANLRGETVGKYGIFWTPLGVVRLGRVGWDTRLGPSDGVRDQHSRRGVTFAPTWKSGDHWIRLADVPDDYHGSFVPEFVHPLLVRCRIDYQPLEPGSGPAFRHDFWITPDGIFATLQSSHNSGFGLTIPLLENDGTPLDTRVSSRVVATRYPGGADEQCFLALDEGSSVDASEAPVRSPYGWLRPVRLQSAAGDLKVFVYPRAAGDPQAADVRAGFHETANGFTSTLGRVDGDLYVGRTSAGGVGSEIDLDGDGRADVRFNESCGFLLQLRNGQVTAAETDRSVIADLPGRRVRLSAHRPVRF